MTFSYILWRTDEVVGLLVDAVSHRSASEWSISLKIYHWIKYWFRITEFQSCSLDGFVDYEAYLKRLFCFPPPSLSLFLSLYLLRLEQAWTNSRHSLNKDILKNKKTSHRLLWCGKRRLLQGGPLQPWHVFSVPQTSFLNSYSPFNLGKRGSDSY